MIMASSSKSYPPLRSAISFTATVITLFCNLFPVSTLSDSVFVNSIFPNFTTSSLSLADNAGAFLVSQNQSFGAQIMSKGRLEPRSFYLVVVHTSSNTVIWSANRNTPISLSSQLRFSSRGLTLYDDTGYPIWSRPEKPSAISSLQLLESGNLVMVDAANNTVWESFDFPTDVIVMGQKLRVGKSLISSVNDEDLSEGNYRLVVENSDATLQWNGMNYWRLSMNRNAFRNSYIGVEYMIMNFTGVYLMGERGEVTMVIVFSDKSNDYSSSFQIMKLDQNGAFSVVNLYIKDGSNRIVFKVPDDDCIIPYVCKSLGVCTNGGACHCLAEFHVPIYNTRNGDCAPSDDSLALPGPCNGSPLNGGLIEFVNLSFNVDYFSNNFMDPVMLNVNLSLCQNLCSRNCSCLGIFHSQSSGSCCMILNHLGSVFEKPGYIKDIDRQGYIKTIVLKNLHGDSVNKKLDFPILAVVLPLSGVLLIAVVVTVIWLRRRKRWGKRAHSKSYAEDEIDIDSVPGLPVRIDYEELVVVTKDFRDQIGMGGFGTVYKGSLKDGTEVAVKKITCSGAQGKREFLTEIAVIGKIRHVNLVGLKGFCTHGGNRFLIYEYMNRGSLDRTLCGGEPVMEWEERYDVAVGTARGLAYLHSGCENKIIHCDVKPENILLNTKSQVKVSDFGLSKLLSPKESGFFTTLRGTRGYIAPEWLTNSAISDKTDAYSYGMVLLEIIRGKKNSVLQARSSFPSGESRNRLVYFPLFALEMHKERRYLELVDPRLMGQVESEEVEKLVRVALCCMHEEPDLRPSMSNVVRMLKGEMDLGQPRIESLKFLRRYDPEAACKLDDNNGFTLHRQPTTTPTPTRTRNNPYNPLSHMSSQQVSGPR